MEPEKAAVAPPAIPPGRARRFARLTRRAALFRYTTKKIIPTARTELYVDYEAAYAWIAELNANRQRSQRVTLNHITLKAFAQALRNHIYLNYAYDGGRHLHPVDQIDIRAPVDLGDFPQFVVVKRCDKLTVEEIAEAFYKGRNAIASSKATPIEERLIFFSFPWVLLTPIAFFLSLGRWILRFFPASHARSLARHRKWFGSFMVSNPGTLGADGGLGVIVRPSIAGCGVWAVKPRPIVRGGNTVVRRAGKVSIAFDHRFVDAGQATRYLLEVRRNIEEPSRFLLRDPAPPMFPGSIGGVLP